MKRLATSTYKTLNTPHGTITYAVAENNSTDNSVDIISKSAALSVNDAVDIMLRSNNKESAELCMTDNEVYIISYSGHDTEITIPETIENYPVTCIAKKAFLSNKLIREIMLPSTITEIGDYAFARCSKLNKVGIPYKSIQMGQGILMECDALTQIYNTAGSEVEDFQTKDIISPVVSDKLDSESGIVDFNQTLRNDVSYMLAATTGILDAPYLFDLESAGSDDWFRKWDTRMKMKMEMDDSEGFSKMLLCGEEDYGSNETDPEFYKHLKRLSKIRVAMLRLMHNINLESRTYDLLKQYLLMHIKGAKHEETWDVILNEHGDEKEYYEFLTDIGGVTENNFELMLTDMGDRHTEMKAFLMKYVDSLNEGKDAFSEFDL